MFTILVVVIIILVIAFVIGVIISGKDYDKKEFTDHPKVLFDEENNKKEIPNLNLSNDNAIKREDNKEEKDTLFDDELI